MALTAFYRSTVGKKIVVAATGVAMASFLLAHMLGNLQVFAGRGATPETTKLNEYAELLRTEMALLWVARLGLITAVVLHAVTVAQLAVRNRAARPTPYKVFRTSQASLASRTMLWGGLAVLFYVVYHVLHFTVGSAHSDLFTPGDVYDNVVRSFQHPVIALVYIAAQIALFFHLSHGVQSAFRTLGVSHPGHISVVTKAGLAFAAIVTLGFVSVPVAVWAGLVR